MVLLVFVMGTSRLAQCSAVHSLSRRVLLTPLPSPPLPPPSPPPGLGTMLAEAILYNESSGGTFGDMYSADLYDSTRLSGHFAGSLLLQQLLLPARIGVLCCVWQRW